MGTGMPKLSVRPRRQLSRVRDVEDGGSQSGKSTTIPEIWLGDVPFDTKLDMPEQDTLARPSVRHRKTINTVDQHNRVVSVNAQQYAVLITDVNQHLWTGEKLWPGDSHREGEGFLSFLFPQWMRRYVMSNYAVHGMSLYDDLADPAEDLSHLDDLTSPLAAGACHQSLQQGPTSSPTQPHSGPVAIAPRDSITPAYSNASGDPPTHALPDVPPAASLAEGSDHCVPEAVQHVCHTPAAGSGQAVGEGAELDAPAVPATTSKESESAPLASSELIEVVIQSGRSSEWEVKAGEPAATRAQEEEDAPVPARSGGELWALVRQAVCQQRVKGLLRDPRYSIVTATFATLFPADFDRAIPVRNHKKVDLAVFRLDFCLDQYSQALAAHHVTGEPVLGRLGCCGLWGRKVDLLEHWQQQVEQAQELVKRERAEVLQSGVAKSWLVFFKRQQVAAMCSQSVMHAEDSREFKVQAAPGPEEVNWPALWMNWWQREQRSWIVVPLLTLLINFPIGIFTGAMTQINFLLCPSQPCLYNHFLVNGTVVPTNETAIVWTTRGCPANTTLVATTSLQDFHWEWYCKQDNVVAVYISKLIVSWVPALLLTLWQGMVLPLVMLLLGQAGGRCYSLSELDVTVATYFFRFNFLQGFIGAGLGAALTQQITQIFKKGPLEAFYIVGTYLPSSSNFFITYLMMRCLVNLPLRLIQPNVGIRMYIFRRWVFRWSRAPLSDRERAFLYAPTSPRFGVEFGQGLLILIIGMAYSVVAPLVTVLALCYCISAWFCWRYLLLYIFIRKYESGGLMWIFFQSSMLWVFGLFGVITSCVFIVKGAFPQAVLLLVFTPVMLSRFSSFCYHRYTRTILHVPLRLAYDTPPAKVDPAAYIPPPLVAHSQGWTPDWCKPWQGWGLPTGYTFV